MQACLHESSIANNHPDSRSTLGLNAQISEPPKNFLEVEFLQQFLEPQENFPEPLGSALSEKQGCLAFRVCVEAWKFSKYFLMLQLGLTTPMAKHLIDLQFYFFF
jgi:hypothetical protein